MKDEKKKDKEKLDEIRRKKKEEKSSDPKRFLNQTVLHIPFLNNKFLLKQQKIHSLISFLKRTNLYLIHRLN